MRYAIVRRGDGLPSLKVQRNCLTEVTGEVVRGSGQRWLLQQIHELRRDDEVCLWSLDVLRLPTAEVLLLLLSLFERGVTVHLTGGSAMETLDPVNGAGRILSLLGEHERRRPRRPAAPHRRRCSSRPLSPHQVRYARELLRRGESRRMVGLLFQLAPDELSEQLMIGDERSPSAGTG